MTTRTLTAPVFAAMGLLLLLGGCAASDETPPSSAPESSAPASSAPASEAPASQQPTTDAPVVTPGATAETLADTSWFGTAAGVAEVTFTLDADGTVDFQSFNGQPFDAATDVWSVDGDTLSLTISQLQTPTGEIIDIAFSGPAATGGMELVGTDGTGATYPMTIAQL